MIKPFLEALKDGFRRIRPSQGEIVRNLRSEGVLIDEEGYYSYGFGDHKEYELAIEPILEDEDEDLRFYVSLYKNRVLLTQRLIITVKKKHV